LETDVPGNQNPGNESSQVQKVLGTKVPKNKRSQEWMFPTGSIHSWERRVLGTKSLILWIHFFVTYTYYF